MINNLVNGFNPVVNNRSEVLILGSFPSVKSLELKEYYGNKGNDFWKIIGILLDKNLHELEFKQKKKILLENKIALWDVYASANRIGSMDNKFVEIIYNDFTSFFKKYSNIHVVMINGNKAYNSFEELEITNKFPYLKIYKIPSTSGANRGTSIYQKTDSIKEIFKNNNIC